MKLRPLQSLCAALLALCPILANAQTSAVPNYISYQGFVVDEAGNAVGAGTPVNRTVIFRIWDNPSSVNASNLIYSEEQTVTVSEGDFSVLVGQGTANTTPSYDYSEASKKLVELGDVFNGSGRYLGVTVASSATIAITDNEISPRQQIVSTAFAFRSKFAEALGTSASGSSLQVMDNGNIGVGNASPPSALTVTAASSSTAAPQLLITATDTTERLRLGVNDTGNGTGFIQAWKEGSGAQNLLLNSDGGNVGIGTIAPTNKLSVTGNADFSGNLGIGVTSPMAKLHVNGVGQFRTGTASDGYVSITPGTASQAGYLGWHKPGGDRLGYMGYDSTDVLLHLENSANFKVMNGSVGLGKTPANRLSVSGQADFSSNVCIGAVHSGHARLSVWGGPAHGIVGSYINGSTVGGRTQHGAHTMSLFTEHSIWCNNTVIASSDRRIKDIEGKSDGSKDLQALLGIDITDYRYKDQINHGDTPQKKVIAQQLETIFPQAVSRQTNVIPDIYEKATILEDGWIELATDLKKGERVRLIATENDEILEVLEVEEKRFRTDFIPEEGEEFLFVYGREVKDFRVVDYDAIAMLNVSATQEIKKEKDAEIAALKAENAALRKQLTDQAVRTTSIEEENKIRDTKDESLEARLIALERRISKGRATETVSLRTAEVAE
ncbi:tail fiber domain-containing protein [bacterium]|nr:tail fiber domain-containing protein [bacterium]